MPNPLHKLAQYIIDKIGDGTEAALSVPAQAAGSSKLSAHNAARKLIGRKPRIQID